MLILQEINLGHAHVYKPSPNLWASHSMVPIVCNSFIMWHVGAICTTLWPQVKLNEGKCIMHSGKQLIKIFIH